jgi:hypothetical protein
MPIPQSADRRAHSAGVGCRVIVADVDDKTKPLGVDPRVKNGAMVSLTGHLADTMNTMAMIAVNANSVRKLNLKAFIAVFHAHRTRRLRITTTHNPAAAMSPSTIEPGSGTVTTTRLTWSMPK